MEDLDGEHPLLTQSEYAEYTAQLAELRRVRDRDLPGLLRDARGFDDTESDQQNEKNRGD